MVYNIFISLCATIFSVLTFLIFDESLGLQHVLVLIFTFLSCFFVYNVLKGNFYARIPVVLILILLASLFNLPSILYLSHLLVLVYFYKFPFCSEYISFKSFREVPFLKTFVLSYVWSAVTVILPCLVVSYPINFEVWIVFVERLSFMIAICVVFDIRDYKKDARDGIKTLPSFIEIRNIKYIALLFIAIFALISFIHYTLFEYLPFFITALFVAVSVIILDINKKAAFYAAFFDGSMILLFILVLLSKFH